MTYVVVDTDGQLHVRDPEPTSPLITLEVGEPGWDMVPLHPPLALRGWVNDSGFLLGLPRNVVGSVMLGSCGAGRQPYAGPVVITGWDPPPGRELIGLRPVQVDLVTQLHRDVRRALGQEPGELTGRGGPEWAARVVEVAQEVATAPSPTLQVIRLETGQRPDEEREWFFTFGHGQRAIAVTSFRTDEREPQPQGFPLDRHYVRIHGTFEAARARMIEMFGVVWCAQYSSASKAGVDEYDLVELVVEVGSAGVGG